jgi:Tol biopolymer transport system component
MQRTPILLPMAALVVIFAACTSGETNPARSTKTSSSTRPSPFPAVSSSLGAGPIDLSSLTGRIAFSGGAPGAEDVYVVNADGTGLRKVTTDPEAQFDPTWAPDGRRIAYRYQKGKDFMATDIFVANADGSRPVNLTRSQNSVDWGPAWSPDGTKIAWNSDRDDPGGGTLHGFVMNPDGSGWTRIPGKVWVEYPAWSPDGTKIAFMGQTPSGSENYEIYVMNADGAGLMRLTDSAASDGFPSWSPDGRRIAFTSTRDDCSMSDAPDCKTTGDIGPYHTPYVMNADGSDPDRLTERFAMFVDWAPSGDYLVFSPGLNIIRPDGSGMTTLNVRVGEPEFPDWAG